MHADQSTSTWQSYDVIALHQQASYTESSLSDVSYSLQTFYCHRHGMRPYLSSCHFSYLSRKVSRIVLKYSASLGSGNSSAIRLSERNSCLIGSAVTATSSCIFIWSSRNPCSYIRAVEMTDRCKAWKTMMPFPTLHTALWKTPMLPASSTFHTAPTGFWSFVIAIGA